MDTKNPVIIIVGPDPEKHLLPPLLLHHVAKLKKDFLLGFVAEEDLGPNTGEALKSMLKQSGYEPKFKNRIIKPGEDRA